VLSALLLAAIMTAGDAAAAGPQVLALQIDLVRIKPLRPGTDKTWVIPAEKRKKDDGGMCNLLALGTAATGVGVVASGAVKTMCSEAASEPGAPAQARMETAPDIYLRLTGGREVLRSYTVAKTLSNTFKWRAVVPVAAVPKTGLVLEVVSDDGGEDEESKEVIGQTRLSSDTLLDAAKNGTLITVADGGVEKLELTVEMADATPRKKTQPLDVHQGMAVLEKFGVAAGEVVEVQALGEYRVAGRGEPVPPAGGMGAATRTFQDGVFKSGSPGAALVRVGKRRLVAGALVTPCAALLSPYEGAVFIGINNQDPSSARGDLEFDVTVRTPTEAEWRTGTATECKPAQAKDDTAELTAFAAKAIDRLKGNAGIAAAILKYTHPTGGKPTLRSIESAPGTKTSARAMITVDWKGGILGGAHATTIGWEFNSHRHIAASLVRDDANVSHAADLACRGRQVDGSAADLSVRCGTGRR
jgi:hypothetical protein